MITNLVLETDDKKIKQGNTALSDIQSGIIDLSQEEIIKKEFENFRVCQVYIELPDHCIQLCCL